MFGIRYIKSQPTVHLIHFKNGKIARQGGGMSFFYYAPSSTLVAIPVSSREEHFMLTLTTSDFQSVTAQGVCSYRISNPGLAASLLDFSIKHDGSYQSEDPQKLGARVSAQVEVVIQQKIQSLDLKTALCASAQVAQHAQQALADQTALNALGIEIQGVSIQAIKPTPEIARALEAEAKEANLKAADDAIYLRRMSAVEKERAIRENELDTQVAIESKQRQIEETKMEARAALMRKENQLRDEQMDADVSLEDKRKAFVSGQAQNTRTLAEADAYRVESLMRALQLGDPRVLQALAAMSMQPGQLIAQAFGGIAENAGKIGQLNLTPDLLSSLLASGGGVQS